MAFMSPPAWSIPHSIKKDCPFDVIAVELEPGHESGVLGGDAVDVEEVKPADVLDAVVEDDVVGAVADNVADEESGLAVELDDVLEAEIVELVVPLDTVAAVDDELAEPESVPTVLLCDPIAEELLVEAVAVLVPDEVEEATRTLAPKTPL